MAAMAKDRHRSIRHLRGAWDIKDPSDLSLIKRCKCSILINIIRGTVMMAWLEVKGLHIPVLSSGLGAKVEVANMAALDYFAA